MLLTAQSFQKRCLYASFSYHGFILPRGRSRALWSETWWESQTRCDDPYYLYMGTLFNCRISRSGGTEGRWRGRAFDVRWPRAVLFNWGLIGIWGGTILPCEGLSQALQDVWHSWPPGTDCGLHLPPPCANQKMPHTFPNVLFRVDTDLSWGEMGGYG